MNLADLAVLEDLETQPPSLAQELERKTLLELERIILGVKNGKISASQARAGILTLFNLVSGLVPSQLMDIASQTRLEMGEVNDGSHEVTRIFRNGNNHVVAAIGWNPEANGCCLYRETAGTVTSLMKDEWKGSVEAKSVFDKYVQSLESKLLPLHLTDKP